jgi:CRISPR-associated protein Csx17
MSAYLKALAIFRLVSEQADQSARAFWGDEYFVLVSALDKAALIEFFLKRYHPTPVLAPWNGGSGFYAKDRKVGIDAIRATTDERFAEYKADLAKATEMVSDIGGEKAGSVKEEDVRRTDILRKCRNHLSDRAVEWLDAAIAIASDGKRAFAPILGTGGNEGRLDYTNNFMENLSRLLIDPGKKLPVDALLEHALFETPSGGFQDIAVGQYDPGRSGGANQGAGIFGAAVANPWNAVLTIEGAIAWSGGIYRKQGISYRSFWCSPFTVRPSAVGLGSAVEKDETTARAEVWTPLWKRRARYGEIRSLLREGRAQVDGRPAKNGLEFAQAVASLGIDRAISSFVRYSLLKRRGDSYIALPAGCFPVHYRTAADGVRELVPYVDRADYTARGSQDEAASSWLPLKRGAQEAMFKALLFEGSEHLVDVLASFGAMCRWLMARGQNPSWPGRLNSKWVRECAERREGRIAVAIASLSSHDVAGSFQASLNRDSENYAWKGPTLAARMFSVLRSRTLAAQNSDQSPFRARYFARPEDIAAFLAAETDDDLIENLIFAFVHAKIPERRDERGVKHLRLWTNYCVLKQLFAPESHAGVTGPDGAIRLKPDSAIPALLAAGRVAEATNVAIRRLRVSGLRPAIQCGRDVGDGVRLGAALLIPVAGIDKIRELAVRPAGPAEVID